MNTDAFSWPEPAPSLARAVAGEFRLLQEIGRGGMGVVYLAEDTQLHRRVAIKTLPPHLAADAAVRDRFLREARTAAALSHPNIVPIYSAAERDAVVYFTMGFVNGESVAERLQRDGPLDVPTSLAIARQLAMALDAAHAEGVVHRDIKAENVLLDGAGRALVTDFGIARLSEAQPLTATGTVLGTVQYMSPEQVTGDALDGRSDLYALGILLFHMLTRRFPFERATPSAVLVAHVNSAPLRLHALRPDAPDAIDVLVADLLEKRPDARVPSARVLLERLTAIDGGAAVLVPTVRPPTSTGAPVPDSALSSADAQAVWARAAELQANTGLMVPPAQFSAVPAEPSPTRGYDMTVVKEAAAEAGIAPKYVERALAEREAAARRAVVQVEEGARLRRSPNLFLGAHTKIEYESVIEGELPLDALEDMADLARRSLGDLISVSAVGRTLTISTNTSRPGQNGMVRLLQLTVAVRNGRTTVRAFEDIGGSAGALLGGIGGGVGMGLGAMTMGILASAQMPVVGIMAWAGILVTAVASGRVAFGRTSRNKQQELRELVQELSRFANAHITEAQSSGALRGRGGQGALAAGSDARGTSGSR
ncbi:serine/threonine-protein kinase [Gemmatimonas sp.]